MADTPIIKIPVDDSAFKAFLGLFDAYAEKVDELPASWHRLRVELEKGNISQAEASKTLESMFVGVSETEKKLKEAAKQQRKLGDETGRTGKAMHKLAESSKKFASSLFGIGKFLMKATGLGMLFGGASLFAIGDMAEAGYNARREASGENVSRGMKSAFANQMGAYVSPGMLGDVARAQLTPAMAGYLRAASGTSKQLPVAQETFRIIERAKKLIDANWGNKRDLQAMLQARGYTQLGITLADAYRLHRMTNAELHARIAETQRLAPQLSLGAGYTNAHIDFQKNMLILKADLMRDFSALTPAFVKASQAITGFVSSIANSQKTQQVIALIAKDISSPQLYRDVGKFGWAIGEMAKEMFRFVRWIKLPGLHIGRVPFQYDSTSKLLRIKEHLEKRFSSEKSRNANAAPIFYTSQERHHSKELKTIGAILARREAREHRNDATARAGHPRRTVAKSVRAAG